MRLLVVEDNAKLLNLITTGLKTAGFESDRAMSVAAAEEALRGNKYAAAIVDLGLPDGDGRDLVASLRARGDTTPVIILTARSGVQDKVSGLQGGADDYLVKPFALEELVARIHALLRRPGDYLGSRLSFGNVELDTVARQVLVAGRPCSFSARETSLLEILLRRPGRVVPKRIVEDHLFGLSEDLQSNAVEVYVHRLRKKLQEARATTEVHTVRGIGYVLMESKG